jgi:glycosyltransferase involved in cell wall biosynthesis
VPEISVVIPTYNREHTLRRAVQSVLGQTFTDFEVIVVDDCSTDQTKNLVESFRDKRIVYVRHDQNAGPGAARNTGIRRARGQLIAFLDSDDEWLPEKLRLQVEFLKGAPSSVEGVCTGYYLHLVRLGMTVEKVPSRPRSWLEEFLVRGCDLTPGTTFVGTARCFARVGLFDEELPRLQDGDWLIRYAKHYQLGLIRKPMARVYSHDRPRGEKVEVSVVRFLKKRGRDLEQLGRYKKRKAQARLDFQVAEAYLREKRFDKGLKWLARGIWANPFQRPGMYLLLWDATFGTSFGPRSSNLKWKVIGGLRGSHAGESGPEIR